MSTLVRREGKDSVSQRNPAADCRADRPLSSGEGGGACAAHDTAVGGSANNCVSRQKPAAS